MRIQYLKAYLVERFAESTNEHYNRVHMYCSGNTEVQQGIQPSTLKNRCNGYKVMMEIYTHKRTTEFSKVPIYMIKHNNNRNIVQVFIIHIVYARTTVYSDVNYNIYIRGRVCYQRGLPCLFC